MEQYPKANIIELHPKDILVKDRGRQNFKGIPELAASIKAMGLIHPPVVEPIEGGKYKLVAGERRFRACLTLLRPTIPCVLRSDLTPTLAKEIELEENIQREDLTWQEQITLTRQIDEVKREIHGHGTQGAEGGSGGWTHEKTAALTGQAKSTVAQHVKFAKQLEERPDLAAKVKSLPLKPAMRQFKQLLEGERMARMTESGQLEVGVSFHHDSALNILKALPSASVDLLLTDPPFGLASIEAREGQSFQTVEGKSQSYTAALTHTDNLSKDDAEFLALDIAPELKRILKPDAHLYIFGTNDSVRVWQRELKAYDFRLEGQPIIWYKGQTTAPFRGLEWAPCYEVVLFGHGSDRTRRLAKPCKSLLEYPPLGALEKLHPFEKPQDLLKVLIEQSTHPGQVVLDCFAGCGSTLVAAHRIGRKAIGVELNEDHYNVGIARLKRKA